jgi:hypothetical protein
MCMCGALRRVVICFGWSGVEEARQRECEAANAGIKDSREAERIECSRQNRGGQGPDMRAAAVERMQKAKRDSRFACPRGQARNDGFGGS